MKDNIATQSASSTVKSFFGGLTGTFGVIIALIIVGLTCCGVSIFLITVASKSDGDTNQSTSSVTETIYNVGEQVKIDDLILTVNEYNEDVTSTNQFIQPASGNKYVAVDVTVTNNGTSSASVYTSNFTIQDTNSYKYDYASSSIKTPDFASGNIEKNGTVRGWIVFEVPNNIDSPVLIFETGYFTTKTVKVKL